MEHIHYSAFLCPMWVRKALSCALKSSTVPGLNLSPHTPMTADAMSRASVASRVAILSLWSVLGPLVSSVVPQEQWEKGSLQSWFISSKHFGQMPTS